MYYWSCWSFAEILFDVMWFPQSFHTFAKNKRFQKEVLYKLTLLLIFSIFSAHAQANDNELMVHQVSQRTEKQTECQNLCYPAMVAREGTSLSISEKENSVYWFITSTVVRSPVPLITLLWVAVCPRHYQRNCPYWPTIR